MKTRTQFVAALFGAGRPSGGLGAPGHADSRWRAVTSVLKDRPRAEVPAPAGSAVLDAVRKYLQRFAARRC